MTEAYNLLVHIPEVCETFHYDHPEEEIEIKRLNILTKLIDLRKQVEYVPFMCYPNEYLRQMKLEDLQRDIKMLEIDLQLENKRLKLTWD